MDNVLVTGGAGFIGSHLVDRLLEDGYNVCVVDNFSTGSRDNLGIQENLSVERGSILDTQWLEEVFNWFKPEVVVHAAASYRDPEAWMDDIMINSIGAVNVVRAAQQVEVRRFINLQSALVYGLKPEKQPVTSDHPLFAGGHTGGSSYAISKAAGELYVELSGLDFISFRLVNVVGPRSRSGTVALYCQRLKQRKKCFVVKTRRDFIYVGDVVDVVMKAVQGSGKKGYYNVATGATYTIREVFDLVSREMGILWDEELETHPREKKDAFQIEVDASDTCKAFKWEPKISLEEAVHRTVAWYRSRKADDLK